MKSVSKVVDFFLPVFFISNIWIILYTKLNDYLYFRFPPRLNEVFFRSGLGNPEPFEISLYIFLTIFFIVTIWLYSKLSKEFRLPISAKIIFLFLLLLLFVSKLGPFPLAKDIHPYQRNYAQEFYNIILFFYLTFLLLVTLQLAIVRFFIVNKNFIFFVYIFIALLVAAITFNPKFSISHPDASLFYGPVYEIASGKTIFTDIPSQYGFLSILLFALFYKLTNINFVYLPILIWVFYIIEYLVCFYLIHKVSKSITLSLLGVFSLLTINYLAATYGPQAGPLRWLPIFLVLFLFYKFKKIDSRRLLIFIPVLSLWNIDSGIALFSGYVLTLLLLFLAKKVEIKKFFSAIIFLIVIMIFSLATIEAVHLLLGFKLVNFFGMYYSLKKLAVIGMLMVPIESYSYFWIVILVYFASIIYFFKQTIQTVDYREWKIDKEVRKSRIDKFNLLSSIFKSPPSIFYHPSSILLFSANLMFFASIYYVGRSMPHELITISVFVLLTIFLFLGSIFRQIRPTKIRIFALLIVFFFLIVFPAYQRKEFIVEKMLDKYKQFLQGNIFVSETDKNLEESYKNEVALVNQNIKEGQTLIISPDDTYLFYKIQKRNLFDSNPVWATIDMQSEMKLAIDKTKNICPDKLVIDCSLVKKCPTYITFVNQDAVVAFPQLLVGIENKCQVKYQPTICTNKLCIATK